MFGWMKLYAPKNRFLVVSGKLERDHFCNSAEPGSAYFIHNFEAIFQKILVGCAQPFFK